MSNGVERSTNITSIVINVRQPSRHSKECDHGGRDEMFGLRQSGSRDTDRYDVDQGQFRSRGWGCSVNPHLRRQDVPGMARTGTWMSPMNWLSLSRLFGQAGSGTPASGGASASMHKKTADALKQLSGDDNVPSQLKAGGLQRIIANADGDYSQKTINAAQYLLDNPEEFNAAMNAGVTAKQPGTLSKGGMGAYLGTKHLDANQANTKNAAEVLNKDKLVKDPITLPGLQRLLKNGGVSKETREAAQYLIDYPKEFAKLDGANKEGATDGTIVKKGLSAYLANDHQDAGAANSKTAAEALAGGIPDADKMKPLKIDDLRAIAGDASREKPVRDAALYFAEHPEEFAKIDSADDVTKGSDGFFKQTKDGVISKNALNAYLAVDHMDASVAHTKEAASVIKNSKDSDFGGNAQFRLGDMASYAANPSYPKDLRTAAQYFADHPEEFPKVEACDSNGIPDGIFTKNSCVNYLDRDHKDAHATNLAEATKICGPYMPLKQENLRGFANDTKLSDVTRDAMQYFIDHPEAFASLTDKSGPNKGVMTRQGMNAYLANEHVPANAANREKAVKALYDDDGIDVAGLKQADFQAIASDADRDQSVRNAAQYFVDNVGEFTSLEKADDGSAPSGILTKAGMQNYLNEEGDEEEEAVEQINGGQQNLMAFLAKLFGLGGRGNVNRQETSPTFRYVSGATVDDI
jgi:NolX protein